MTRISERGAGPLGSILALLFGGGAAMVVIALFMTGLAQEAILPRIKARAERAMADVRSRVDGARSDSTAVAEMDPAVAGSTAGSASDPAVDDSLAPHRSQLETEKAFLAERERELQRMRGGIDSLINGRAALQETELKRQAKLLAAMRADEAARVLAAMPDPLVQALLAQMNARAASKVLGKLDPVRVARLSTQAMTQADLSSSVLPSGSDGTPAIDPAVSAP